MLPPDLREWVPADHLVHFILAAVEPLDGSAARVNERGGDCAPYPPRMLLALLDEAASLPASAASSLIQVQFHCQRAALILAA